MFLLLYCITDKSFTGIDHMSQQVNVLPFEPGFIFDSFRFLCCVFVLLDLSSTCVLCVSVS